MSVLPNQQIEALSGVTPQAWVGNESGLKALCDAVQIGIDDMEAGRFVRFRSAEEMDLHLRALMENVICGSKKGFEPA
jgi:hypothetical protein